MKQQIENIIKKNLPEKNEIYPINVEKQDEKWNYLNGFNQALSKINPSKISDEVLKVVVEKIRERQQFLVLESIITKENRNKMLSKIEELEVIINRFD